MSVPDLIDVTPADNEDPAKDAFIEAVGRGNVAEAEAYLKANPGAASCINEADARRPLLVHAVWTRNNFDNDGKVEMVKLLLAHGAAVDAPDVHGNTAFYYAAWSGVKDVTELLLDSGANPNFPNEKGETALMCCGYHRTPEVIELLLQKGADIEAQDENGWTPLMWAARNHMLMLETLLKYAPKLDVQGTGGETALSIAAGWGDGKAAQLLLEAGADPDPANSKGETARDISLRQTHNEQHLEIAGMVLDKQCEKIAAKVNEGTGKTVPVRTIRLKPKM